MFSKNQTTRHARANEVVLIGLAHSVSADYVAFFNPRRNEWPDHQILRQCPSRL